MAEPVEIHGYVNCPYAWRVRLTAAEKGIDADWIPCDVAMPDPRAAAHNPDEHSPLLYDAGFALLESEVIMQYLDERGPGRPLMPGDLRLRAELRWLTTVLRSLDVHTEPSRPEARRHSEPALRRLGAAIADGKYLLGSEPTLTDFAILPFVANLGVRGLLHPGRDAAVIAYLARFVARPSFAATRPPWADPLLD